MTKKIEGYRTEATLQDENRALRREKLSVNALKQCIISRNTCHNVHLNTNLSDSQYLLSKQ